MQLAPPPPRCFPDRLQWHEWLSSLHDSKADWTQAGGKLLILEPGQPARFNLAISFCFDCSREYRSRMLKEGRCNPGHLRDIERAQFEALAA